MPASRSVESMPHHRRETFLNTLKIGPVSDSRRTLRRLIAQPPGRVDVLLRAIPARGMLVIEPVLGSPTTTRTPQPPKRGLDPVPHDGRLPHYIESPPGGFQWPLASASDR